MQTPSRLAARLARAWPAAAGAALLLALVHQLLDPRAVLVARDVFTFHLPLRTVAAELAALHGVPEWNPLIHGGQPILSNPNYAWFYPPTWLALVVPVHWSLGLVLVLHAALAFAGTWRLLRRLGCDPPAAGLGAMGFAASPWFLPLAHTFTSLCGFAWLPWIVVAGDRALSGEGAARRRAALLAAGLLALQLLAGEPVPVLVSGLALGCLALGAPRALPRALPRLLVIAGVAALLAAAQLVPTAARLSGSARGNSVAPQEAGLWSARPARLVDFVLPRFWGDALRDESGLWLGWNIHDRAYPFVLGLYAGLLLFVLAAAAVARWPIPHRAAWGLAFGLGIFLGLGRHNPLWEPLREVVPLLGIVRYPERFLLLSAAVVPIAGALGWQHLTRGGERRGSPWPAILAGAVAVTAGTLLALLLARSDLGRAFVADHSGSPLSPAALARVLGFLRTEAVVATLLGLATTALLLVARRARGARVWDLAAFALLSADLAWYARGALPVAPAAELLAPPPLARRAQALGGRVYSVNESRDPTYQFRLGPEGQQQLRNHLEQLFPYSGNLWRVPYALNVDYDLMLTRWGRHAVGLAPSSSEGRAAEEAEWRARLLGAWDVRMVVMRRPPAEIVADLRRTGRPPARYRGLLNDRVLPRFRFVERVGRLQAPEGAAEALRAIGYDLRGRDGCIGADAPAPARFGPARLLAVEDAGQVVRLRYQAEETAFLVAAMVFDQGWSATIEDGTEVPACPTLLGQIGLRVPPGAHELELRYRDPWVRVGASLTLASLLGCTLAARRLRPSGPSENEAAT